MSLPLLLANIPGDKSYELPPIVVGEPIGENNFPLDLGRLAFDMEGFLPEVFLEGPQKEISQFELSSLFAHDYVRLCAAWVWGSAFIHWTEACADVLPQIPGLGEYFSTNVWPHPHRLSLVKLLQQKLVVPKGLPLPEAIGVRLTFRILPPIEYFSDVYLALLSPAVSTAAFKAWSGSIGNACVLLPHERFHFQVLEL